jgi:hypothetical protein
MIHAELDTDNVCIGHGNLTNIESAPNLVYLPNGWNEDFLWRKYENGAWSADKFPPAPPVPGPDLPAEIDNLKSTQADILFAMVTNNLM